MASGSPRPLLPHFIPGGAVRPFMVGGAIGLHSCRARLFCGPGRGCMDPSRWLRQLPSPASRNDAARADAGAVLTRGRRRSAILIEGRRRHRDTRGRDRPAFLPISLHVKQIAITVAAPARMWGPRSEEVLSPAGRTIHRFFSRTSDAEPYSNTSFCSFWQFEVYSFRLTILAHV